MGTVGHPRYVLLAYTSSQTLFVSSARIVSPIGDRVADTSRPSASLALW